MNEFSKYKFTMERKANDYIWYDSILYNVQ